MKRSFASVIATALASVGIGSIAAKNERTIKSAASRPEPVNPDLPPSRRIMPRAFGYKRQLPLTDRDTARLEKRAVRDLRACRMNYTGWCGFEESGSATAVLA